MSSGSIFGTISVTGSDRVVDGLMFGLNRFDQVGQTRLRVAAQAPDHASGGVFKVLAERFKVGIVRGQHDGLVKLIILLVSEFVARNCVLHANKALANAFKILGRAALGGKSGGCDFDRGNQLHDVRHADGFFDLDLIDAKRLPGVAGRHKNAHPAFGRNQPARLQARKCFPDDWATYSESFAKVALARQTVSGRHSLGQDEVLELMRNVFGQLCFGFAARCHLGCAVSGE